MRLIFPKTSKRTSLWQGQTHWELMYFFWLWRETGKRDLYEGHRNTNYKSRLMSSKYHIVKWLLFSSSQFSEQSKTFGALVWHICLPDPSLPWGSNPQAGVSCQQSEKLLVVGTPCFCQSRAQEILVGWNKRRGRRQLLEFHDYSALWKSQAPEPEPLMYLHQTSVEQSILTM